jgi:uncharacterized protein
MLMWRDDWALITGASSGFGREFALQLAAAGMNCVLVARRGNLLESLARELKARHGAESVVVVADLSEPQASRTVKERVDAASVTIRMLVNNAAAGKWGRFEGSGTEDYERMLRLNNGSLVGLCSEFFPHLRSFRGSAIINVSSQAAFQPVPFMAAYAATKAFTNSFSLALYEEWKQYGIHVYSMVPGPSATDFDANAGAYESALQSRLPPAGAVAMALAQVGHDRPMIVSAKGVYKQRLFTALFPAKQVVRAVAKMFRPPDER